MRSVTYYGQDVRGWDSIGTPDYKIPITQDMDVEATVEDLKRCCGSDVFFYLYKEDEDDR